MRSRIFFRAVILSLFAAAAAPAAVVLDGSLGPSGALTGPHFSLNASNGKRVGSNLFYSFSDFSLVKGDVATFSSHVPVKNVLARVTGGNVSNIDGTLQVTIPNASFYLINPAGVIFGPDSALDVKGSFAVTTANELKFADGGHLDTHLPDTSLLTTAAPAAFGFLGKPAAITVNNALFSMPTGSRVIVAGGDFTGNAASILAPSGHISISSSAAAGDVAIGPDLAPASPATGNVSLTNTALIADGNADSRIDIHAGNLTMQASLLTADTFGAQPSDGIGLFLSGNLRSDNSLIDSSTIGSGNAGSIDISATDVSFDNTNASVTASGIKDQSRPTGTGGNSGDVIINAASLHLHGGAGIDISTSGTGNGGTIRINAGTVILDGTGASPQAIDAIAANTSSTAANAGHGGDIDITTTWLHIVDGFAIECAVLGAGNGGNVNVQTKSLLINEQLSSSFTQIASDGRSSATGPAGNVSVVADTIDLLDGGLIKSNTAGLGAGGEVFVSAHNMTLDGGSNFVFTGISSESTSGAQGGPAGQVQVKAGNIQMDNQGEIESDSDGMGAAGSVAIKATTLHIDGGNSDTFFTGVSSDSDSQAQGGNAGDVNINAKTIQLVHGGQISSTTEGTGNGGNVTVTADSFAANGDASGIFADSDNVGTTGNAGVIHLNANSVEVHNFAQIETDTSGTGNAGDIVIQAKSARIDGGQSPQFTGVSSEAEDGATGKAGDVSIAGDNLLLIHGGQILSDTDGSGVGGNITVSAKVSLTVNGQSFSANPFTEIDASSDADATAKAGNVNVQAGNLQILRGGFIISDAFGAGAGGSVNVRATTLTADSKGSAEASGIVVNAAAGSTGSAGDITVSADTIGLLAGGIISSDTFGQGHGGSVTVQARSMTFDEQSGSLLSGIDASTEGGASGAAGNISIKGKTLRILNGADIQADTFGQGNGGSVSVDANLLHIDGSGLNTFTGISAGTDPGATGSAGEINVAGSHNTIQLINGGQISSTTDGTGAAGSIRISAASFSAAGGTSALSTGVFVESSDASSLGGNAGNLILHANGVSLTHGGFLSTSTDGGGSAGQIQIFATNFAATGSNTFSSSGAFSQSNNAQLAAAGSAGDVIVRASSLDLDDGAALSALTSGSGRGGNISLFANSLRFAGNTSMDATSAGSGRAGDLQFHVGKMDLENMDVLTRSNHTSGGNITIHASQRVSLFNSQLSTSAHGNGGNITIDPLAVALNHSQVLANAFQGNGGNITITSDAFVQSPDSVVNASSKLGLSGNIAISAPNADVVQGLARLNESPSQQIGLQETCAQRFTLSDFSSFVVEGSGGLPLEPGQSEMSFTIHQPTTQPDRGDKE